MRNFFQIITKVYTLRNWWEKRIINSKQEEVGNIKGRN